MTCGHENAAVVANAAGEPVRLICPCGREWRVIPERPDPTYREALRAWLDSLPERET